MNHIYTFCVALFGLILLGNLVESHDPINSTSRLLRELRRLRKHNEYYGTNAGLLSALAPIRNDNSGSNYNANSNSNNNNNYNNNGQAQDNNRAPAAAPAAPAGINAAAVDAQLAQAISQLSQLPTRPPYQLEMVNRGVATILGGVNQGNLADILRGSFQFTRNENVRSVAGTVIDSIFGQRGKK